MNRRTLLKNMFGAAVIAALPKRVIEQIESIPPDPIIKEEKDVIEYAKEQIISGNDVLYIYDENQLVGHAHNFHLNMHNDIIPVEYIQGLTHWNLQAYDIHWHTDVQELIINDIKLNCLILHEDTRITGDIYIQETELISPMRGTLRYSARFEGYGKRTNEKRFDRLP